MLLLRRIMVRICIVAYFIIIIPLALLIIWFFYLAFKLPEQITANAIIYKTQYFVGAAVILYVLAIVLFLLAISYILRKYLLPLKKTLHFSKQLASGDFSGELKVNTKDELGDLIRTIKHMRDRLQYSVVKLKNSYEREKKSRKEAETADKQKTEFLEKASMELHSPLIPIISHSNLILAKIDEGKYDKELERKIKIIRAYADNMLSIISNLNEFSKLEANIHELNIVEIDTSKFIEELINLHHYSVARKELLLKCVFSRNFPDKLYTDRDILFHILGNILIYSIHFSSKKAEITIKAESTSKEIIFMISHNIGGPEHKAIMQIFQDSSARISNMALHLGDARQFGLICAIASAELIEGLLTEEQDSELGHVFKLALDKDTVTTKLPKELLGVHSASNLKVET